MGAGLVYFVFLRVSGFAATIEDIIEFLAVGAVEDPGEVLCFGGAVVSGCDSHCI